MTLPFRTLRLALVLGGALIAASGPEAALAQAPCPVAPASVAAANKTALHTLFAKDAMREDALDPLAALYRGEVQDLDAISRIYSDALDRDRLASARADRAELAKIDRCMLPDEIERISYDVFAGLKDEEIASLQPEIRALTGVRPFNHFGGIHLEFPAVVALGSVLPYASEADYRRTLSLYRVFPKIVDNAILRFREGMANGAVEPRLTVANMVAQIDALLAQPIDQSPFASPLTAFPEAMPQATRDALSREYRSAIDGDVMPAYRRLHDFLSRDYLPAARDSIGLLDMKGGERLYRMAIERETTLALDPDEVHQLGLGEVARIQAEMEKVKHQLGYSGPLRTFFDRVRSDPRFHPRTAAQLSDGFLAIGRKVDALVPRYFSVRPRTELVISPYPDYRAKYEAGGSYSEGDAAEGTPGTFFFNTYDLKQRFLSGMTTLYLHEGVPGHHFQVSLARENTRLPDFQRFGGNNAYVEGWALYAETLGYSMGFYTDPLQHWGTLDDEMLRAMRLVVDTGIHAKGWSREKAVDYMLSNSGMGRSDAESEVDRYVAMPAQALSYKIGALTIQRLRARAEAALGARFDLRAFHGQVLGSGALPLPILEAKIDRWIARGGR